jgi:hypothetical protein
MNSDLGSSFQYDCREDTSSDICLTGISSLQLCSDNTIITDDTTGEYIQL